MHVLSVGGGGELVIFIIKFVLVLILVCVGVDFSFCDVCCCLIPD